MSNQEMKEKARTLRSMIVGCKNAPDGGTCASLSGCSCRDIILRALESVRAEALEPYLRHEDRARELWSRLSSDPINVLTAALAEADAAATERVAKWQAIETAPQDGTVIWLSDGFALRLGLWLQERWADFAACERNTGRRDLLFTPTHWTTVPKSPRAMVAYTEAGQ